METEKVNIKHSFTNIEQLAFGREQAQQLGKKDELESQLKSAKTQFQSQIDVCSASIRVVSNRLMTGYEMRDVDCIVMDNRVPGYRHLVRMDDGHIARVRKLQAHERQMKINEGLPVEFTAIIMFPVDDQDYEGDYVELHVVDEEFEMLRTLPDLKVRDLPKAMLGEKQAKKSK